MGNQYLGLSLFIIILCFFILLNQHANFSHSKTQNVIQSLEMAFSNRIVGDESQPIIQQQAAEARQEEGHVFDDVNALFSAHIPDFTFQQDKGKERLSATMDLKSFRAALDRIETLITTDDADPDIKPALLDTLITLAQQDDTQTPYRINISLGTTPALYEEISEAEKKAEVFEVLAALSVQFSSSGFPQDLLSLSVIEGRSDVVNIEMNK